MKYLLLRGGMSLSKYDPNSFLRTLGFRNDVIQEVRNDIKQDPLYQHFFKLCRSEQTEEQLETELEVLFPLVYLLPITISLTQSVTQMTQSFYPYNIEDKVGEGSYGVVYRSGDWTVKINTIAYAFQDHKVSQNLPYGALEFLNLLQEMAYYYLFSKKGIGPEIGNPAFFIDLKRGYSSIVTRRYTGDVGKLFDTFREKDLSHIEDRIKVLLVRMLKEGGVFCSDIKPTNFLADWDGMGVKKIVATDFGTDWCCNSVNRPVCRFFFRNPDLLEHSDYLIRLQCLAFAVFAFQYNRVSVFYQEMEALQKDCDTRVFQRYLTRLCGAMDNCDRIEPPFYYLRMVLKKNYLKVPIENIDMVKRFLQLYFEKKT